MSEATMTGERLDMASNEVLLKEIRRRLNTTPEATTEWGRAECGACGAAAGVACLEACAVEGCDCPTHAPTQSEPVAWLEECEDPDCVFVNFALDEPGDERVCWGCCARTTVTPLYPHPHPDRPGRDLAEDIGEVVGFVLGWWPGLEGALDWPNPEKRGRGKQVYEAAKRLRSHLQDEAAELEAVKAEATP